MSSIAAIASLAAASACCLPVGTFLVAAGSAGAARILTPLRPWLIGISIGALVLGFVQTYGRSQCSIRRNLFSVILLWASAVVVLITLLFPQLVAGLIADKLPGAVR